MNETVLLFPFYHFIFICFELIGEALKHINVANRKFCFGVCNLKDRLGISGLIDVVMPGELMWNMNDVFFEINIFPLKSYDLAFSVSDLQRNDNCEYDLF